MNGSGPRSSRQPVEVADRVYRLGTKWVSFYLVEEEGGLTLIDAGYPRYWPRLAEAVSGLGLDAGAVRGVLVTHHHVDHAGTAEHVRAHANSPVFVGRGDAAIVRGERSSHPPAGFWGQWWRPSMLAYLLHSALAGGSSYRAVARVEELDADATLELPGAPRVIQTPGHTTGHFSVFLERRGVLLTGDAMVNFDYATGTRQLGLHRFNEDRDAAVASLQRLEGIEAEVVLFAHGEPWTGGLAAALERVRERA